MNLLRPITQQDAHRAAAIQSWPRPTALFERAREPKEFWAVDGARHEDLHAFAGDIYEQRVGEFLARHLRATPASIPAIVSSHAVDVSSP